jgi:hypothetical protein
MDAKDRDTADVLQKLLALGSCNETATCPCSIHALLLRILDEYRQEREREFLDGYEKQRSIEEQKSVKSDD